MIETHAHIYDKAFEADRQAMLDQAFADGIQEIWMPNCNSETIAPMLALEENPKCRAMMGLHPCYVDENYNKELGIIKEELAKRPYFMIGEIGLDFYWDLSHVENQKKAFLEQLALAKQYNVPICIHSRNSKDGSLNAIQACCDLIEEFNWPGLRGIFHCFSGNLADAKRVIGLNFKLGIGGVLTFKNGGIREFLPEIGLEYLVLETDSPYLAPVPNRGKRNEVSYLKLVAEKMAETLGISLEEVIKTTTQNALTFIAT